MTDGDAVLGAVTEILPPVLAGGAAVWAADIAGIAVTSVTAMVIGGAAGFAAWVLQSLWGVWRDSYDMSK